MSKLDNILKELHKIGRGEKSTMAVPWNREKYQQSLKVQKLFPHTKTSLPGPAYNPRSRGTIRESLVKEIGEDRFREFIWEKTEVIREDGSSYTVEPK